MTIPASGPGSRFDVGTDEYAITCTFAAPAPDDRGQSGQEAMCTLPNGAAVFSRLNDEQGGHAHGVRVFTGLRMDPYFLDIPGYVETLATRRLASRAKGTNTPDGWNILSIVVELDAATVLGSARRTLLAVAAETITAGKLPCAWNGSGVRRSRTCTCRITELTGQPRPRPTRSLGAYRARLNANLAFMDSLDGKIDWPVQQDGTHPLTELLLADFQVVDVAQPFAEDSYLEIEQALLRGRAHETCGGRSLNNDAIDTTATLVYTGGNGPRISDGVDQQTVRASQSFPYLAPPNPNPPVVRPAMLPAKVADQLALIQEANSAPATR